MTRRGGLGRGLGALIPTGPDPDHSATGNGGSAESAAPPGDGTAREDAAVPDDGSAAGHDPDGRSDRGPSGDNEGHSGSLGAVPGATYREIPVDSVRPNPRQPRQVFDEDALAELTHSVREFGLLQPIVVRPRSRAEDMADGVPDGDAGDEDTADDHIQFELVMGERRWRAAQAAGLTMVPAIVRHTDDDVLLRDALLENVHRVDLNPLEEAAAYEQLLGEFGVTHEQLATTLGRSRSQVTNTVRLLRLPVRVQSRVAAGVLSAGHARALLGLADAAAQDALAGRIVAEGLSVRATEEIVAFGDGDATTPAVRRATRRPQSPALAELGSALSDAFDTRVRIDLGRRRGKITVEFGSLEDLERLVGLIAPDVRTRATRD